MNEYAILAGGALAILAITEILVTRQKAQMRKQFLEELDRQDSQKKPNSGNSPDN